MRLAPALSALLLGVAFAAPAAAQGGAAQKPDTKGAPAKPSPAQPKPQAQPAKPSAPKVDPAVLAIAQKLAGSFSLSSADGARACPVTLKAEPTATLNFAAAFDPGACASIPFTLQVAAWAPDPSGAIRFTGADGRTVVEFTEATGGAYEALREGDGVYFLSSPSTVATVDVTPEEMIGDWNLARSATGPVLCRWSLTGEAQPGGLLVRAAPGCDAALGFSAATWKLEGGNVVITSTSDASSLRFARQEDGGWAKTPERGRPLLLLRP